MTAITMVYQWCLDATKDHIAATVEGISVTAITTMCQWCLDATKDHVAATVEGI